MRLAIVIGVSDYSLVSSLPACKNDASIINNIVSQSGKFDKILYLSENTNSYIVKPAITKFITENRGNDIEELFFYFSGHGLFANNEFHYALSDADTQKLKQTSLENSELDQLIRSLSPELTIKIVDACQSGVDYIKSADHELEKLMKQKIKELSKCYFMLSSNSDQNSYASPLISYFTRYIVEAITSCNSGEIRYKEIMDYVSDSFQGNKNQTPLFISQANFTETFISVDVALKELINKTLSANLDLIPDTNKASLASLLEKIKADAKRYLDKDSAIHLLLEIEDMIKSKEKFEDHDAKELFQLSHITNQYNSSLPKLTHAAEWLKSSSDDFFVAPYWETHKVKKQVRKQGIHNLITMSVMGVPAEYEYKEVDEEVCTDITNTTEIPFCNIISKAERRFPNINSCECIWLFFISETRIAILTTFIAFKTTDWDKEIALKEYAKWTSKAFDLTNADEIKNYISSVYLRFKDFSLEPIIKRLNTDIVREVPALNPNVAKPQKNGKNTK